MKNNSFLNALSAAVYIVLVGSIMKTLSTVDVPDKTIFAPIFVVSLFVLSTAMMGYLFLAEPFHLYFDNHKKEATSFFLKTVAYFTVFVAIFYLILINNM